MGKTFLQRRAFRVGFPFLLLVVGGSFGLKEFAQIRYDFRNRRNLTKDEADKVGIQMKESTEVTLETEYEKIREIDTSTWENVRGPRPWEDDSKLYAEAMKRASSVQGDA